MIFKKKAFARAVNEFSSKDDVSEVLTFVKQQRVAGELVVSLPGNGGVAAIVFREKERPATIDEQSI